MKYNALLVNIFILLGIAAAGYGITLWLDNRPMQKAHENRVETQLPEFSFKTIDGKTHHSMDFKNKIVVINFWASWCAPCVKEFPNLLEIARRHPDDMVLIALSSDIDEAAIKNFQKRTSMDWDNKNIFIALDREDTTGKLFGTRRLPETLIFARDRTLRTKLIGAEWTIPEFENNLK